MSSVQIDGEKIRILREQQELTQLYLATFVGVTTDTISRWENNRYPAIKEENGRKLAEALNVPLDALLQEEKKTAIAAETTETSTDNQPLTARQLFLRLKKNSIIPALAILVLAVFLFLFFEGEGEKETTVIARRILPLHAAPGVPFPVLIQLDGTEEAEASLLVREELSCSCAASGWTEDGEQKDFARNPRWIGRMIGGKTVFCYMVIADGSPGAGGEIVFTGDVVIQQAEKEKEVRRITGPSKMALMPYHWADKNRDYVVSDEEILMAYETYAIPGVRGIDFSRLEELWLAGGYRWDGTLFIVGQAETPAGAK